MTTVNYHETRDTNGNVTNIQVAVTNLQGHRVTAEVPASSAQGVPLNTVADAVSVWMQQNLATLGRGNAVSAGQVLTIARSVGSQV